MGERRGLSWQLPAVLDRAPTILCDSRTPQAEEGSEKSSAVTYFFPRHFNGEKRKKWGLGGEGKNQAEAIINCPLVAGAGFMVFTRTLTRMTDENPQIDFSGICFLIQVE